MITLKKNKHINLKTPEFTCDLNPIGEHLNEYDMLKHFNNYGFNAFIGKPGSGKTSLLISMLTGKKKDRVFRKAFDHILLVMPKSSRESMKENIFKKHHEDKMYDTLNIDSISNIKVKLLASTAEKENTLLILDDVGASLKDSEIQKQLCEIIYNRRHLKVMIIILVQNFTSIPLSIRILFTNVICFKPSKKEFEKLFEELFETKKEKAVEIMKYVFTNPHDYLMLNVDSQCMYKMFDQVIINDPNEN